MLPSYSIAPALGCAEPELYHDASRAGYFALIVRDPVRGYERRKKKEAQGLELKKVLRLPDMFQTMHKLKHLESAIRSVDPQMDTFVSQCAFRQPQSADGTWLAPNRQAINVSQIPIAFLDLDVYVKPYEIDKFVRDLLSDIEKLGIPKPSLVVFSGRGFHIKWIFEYALPGQALPRWNAVQRELAAKFAPLPWKVDSGARDASRVLRLVSTVNTRSGQRCEPIWADLVDGRPRRYSFDLFADAVLPLTREEHRAMMQERFKTRREAWAAERALRNAKAPHKGRHLALNREQLAWDRLGDIRRLAVLRAPLQDDPRAKSGDLVFWGLDFLALSGSTASEDLEDAGISLADELWPQAWMPRSSGGWSAFIAPLMKRLAAHERGLKGQIYTPRNDTLIERLAITDVEQRELKTLISSEEKRRRANDQKVRTRRAAGVVSRDEYLSRSDSRQRPWDKLGVSRTQYYENRRRAGPSTRS